MLDSSLLWTLYSADWQTVYALANPDNSQRELFIATINGPTKRLRVNSGPGATIRPEPNELLLSMTYRPGRMNLRTSTLMALSTCGDLVEHTLFEGHPDDLYVETDEQGNPCFRHVLMPLSIGSVRRAWEVADRLRETIETVHDSPDTTAHLTAGLQEVLEFVPMLVRPKHSDDQVPRAIVHALNDLLAGYLRLRRLGQHRPANMIFHARFHLMLRVMLGFTGIEVQALPRYSVAYLAD